MSEPAMKPAGRSPRSEPPRTFDMETLVGYILLGGVLLSACLLVAGVVWNAVATGRLEVNYSIAGVTFFQFLLADLRQVTSGVARPRLLISLGIAVLLLTPYLRVMASMFYFALGEHNRKFTLFTLFVLSVLTYSLFLR